ncbi:SRPBCC family protein [Sphingomonas sp.]|uniref:SRPBCC family protein n=1 Tax=Sphingomonas sp. TaxID=28214 RepID=UPI00286DE91A|nr:SRPBCC family protein [Sphingomonas sp.]
MNHPAQQRIAPAAIRKTIEVRAPIQRAFEVFAGRMGEWWHKEHSVAAHTIQIDVVIEPRGGGRWYEKGADGSEHMWGRVLAWEPPSRLVLAWQLNREFDYDPDFATTVEVNFEARGEVTIVHFEHRDLERMGEGAAQEFESMDGGWGMLLGLFKSKVEAA